MNAELNNDTNNNDTVEQAQNQTGAGQPEGLPGAPITDSIPSLQPETRLSSIDLAAVENPEPGTATDNGLRTTDHGPAVN